MKKILSLLLVMVVVLSACGTSDSGTRTLRLAHGAPEGSAPAEVILDIPGLVRDNSGDSLDVQVYGSGVLGSEPDTIELVEAGVLDMAKVGGSSIESFAPIYGVLALPFLFEDEDHLYSALNCTDVVEQFNDQTYDDGFIMIGWYPSGARNFYTTSDTPITSPDDLKGQNIRVMQSATSSALVSALGGTPTPMAASETYTALQQGVIDGAENNELALTANSHKDVITSYSYTEHQMVPDIFIMSTDTFESLSDQEVKEIQDALKQNNEDFRAVNTESLLEARTEAEDAGVEFIEDIDKEPFKEAVQPLHDDYKSKGEEYEKVYNTIIEAEGETCN